MTGYLMEKRNMNEEELLKNLEIAAKKAGQLMLGASHIEDVVTQKGDFHNLVTEYDKKVQEYLFEKLSRLLPEAKFMGEEEDQDHFRKEYKEGWLFVIDPIDGTSNFIRRYRPSVTSIGLFLNGKPHIGIVYNPYHDLLYTACSGKGAYLNGRRLRGSDTPLRDSLVCMGTAPYYGEKTIRRAFDTAYWYMSRCIDIRRSGAAAWDLCQVAEGTCGVFFEPKNTQNNCTKKIFTTQIITMG